MRTLLDRFSFLVVSLAGWMNQHRQYGIHYLIEEPWNADGPVNIS